MPDDVSRYYVIRGNLYDDLDDLDHALADYAARSRLIRRTPMPTTSGALPTSAKTNWRKRSPITPLRSSIIPRTRSTMRTERSV